MYKFYKNGEEFLKENKEELGKEYTKYMFFFLDSSFVTKLSADNYIIKLVNDDNNEKLYLLNDGLHSTLIEGSPSLVGEACKVIYDYNLNFNKLLGSPKVIEEFSKQMPKYFKGSLSIDLDMDLMELKSKTDANGETSYAHESDIEELTELTILMHNEAVGDNLSYEQAYKTTKDNYQNIKVMRKDNKIVSIAKVTRNNEFSASIALVYTRVEYRGLGLAYQVVGDICNDIINSGKVAYLFVDKTNPISNHLYTKLGFTYGDGIREASYNTKIKTAVFAGGCFWCMAKPYYDYKGVLDVTSGYAGGSVIEPKYQEVKSGTTGHKETVKITYDSSVISYYELLKVFFESIDPFDPDGQFIDRGESYTTAVFTSDKNEIEDFKTIVDKIEKEFKRDVAVRLDTKAIFYKAEDYHQNYALKNKEAFEHEEEVSNRRNFDYIKIKE